MFGRLILLVSLFSLILSSAKAANKSCNPPPFISASAPPLTMIVMGRDHKLYYEAYNDASDLDEDGILDVGYKHSIDYYGYFDPYKCYRYDGWKFVPTHFSSNKYCGGTDEWSGNFLNWLSMSRMDVLRKVLYGGYRAVDTIQETVLEGVFIPQDAHSWGKEYSGSDTRLLTPFDAPSGGNCILPDNQAPWNQIGKILMVIYDDNKSNIYGDNHEEIINSFSTCDYYSHEYLQAFDTTFDYTVRSRIDTGNYLLVAEFYVDASSAGEWHFAVDSDDGSEVEIDGQIVASYYGEHWYCVCKNCSCNPNNCEFCKNGHKGTIFLNEGWHRIIVRLRENYGDDGVIVWYKKPGDNVWSKLSASNLGTNNLRAPQVDDVCRLKTRNFIISGEPGYGGKEVSGCRRHLFCVTSLNDGEPHRIRVLLNKSNRIWEWASKERPVCDNSLGSPDEEYFVRVKVCDPTKGLEENCKQYPNGNYKPIGLLQKYGEGKGKVCSKSFKACNSHSDCSEGEGKCLSLPSMFFGLLTGSYTKNLSGGVLRKNIWNINDEIDNETGIFKSPGNGGSIIQTINKLKTVGFTYSNYTYNQNCGWITTHALNEGECRMWGNPVAEMMYEALRYFAGKESPTSSYIYTQDKDDGLALPKPSWNDPYEDFPSCARPALLVISDVNPSYDTDQLPGSKFGSFSGDLPGLDVGSLTSTIGSNETIHGNNYFIGQSGNNYDFICSAKMVSDLAEARGLCPEEPTKKGGYYAAAVAYYGNSFFKEKVGRQNVSTYAVALSSPLPEIKIKVGDKIVTLVPVGKSVSGCMVYNPCAQRCSLSNETPRGLTIYNCDSDAYCPSNQIVDFYVVALSDTYGKFSINFEDVEQGADHDMDAIVEYEYEVLNNNQVKISLSSTYAAGCIDQVMGFVITGTTEDGLYLPVRDKDTYCDSDSPSAVCNLPLTWSYTFSVAGNSGSARLLKNPLWYAAKWGGFTDSNGNNIPDLPIEWDVDQDQTPDHYFYVTNPLRLYRQLDRAFKAIMKKSGTAGAVATVTQEVLGEDLVVRGALTAYDENPAAYTWRGHLEVYWPYEGCSSFNDKETCLQLGCAWTDTECKGKLYSFQLPQNAGKFCSDEGFSGGHCWDAGELLKNQTSRDIFTFLNGAERSFELLDNSTLKVNVDFDGNGSINDNDVEKLKNWIKGEEDGDGVHMRKRDGWILGDIVYSTPVVVGAPSPASVPQNTVGNCNCTCVEDGNINETCAHSCFYCYRYKYQFRDKVVYVGANDGMLHAFLVGERASDGTWVYEAGQDPDGDGHKIGEELWAYIPSNLLSELKCLAKPDYGTENGCRHRTMVDLSPEAWDVYIDHDNDGDREWRTVLIGGERGGGDVYFAIDVTDPDEPRILWEFSVLRNMVKIEGNQAYLPYFAENVYRQIKTIAASWSKPYVGRLNLGGAFYVVNKDGNLKKYDGNDLSGWFAFIGGGARVFNNSGELVEGDNGTAFYPHLLIIDIEKGVNIFQFIWPYLRNSIVDYIPQSGENKIPYVMADPLAIDLNNNGYIDRLYIGDLNGFFYGLKFDDSSNTNLNFYLDIWRTKKDSNPSHNSYRSNWQPITVQPVAALDYEGNLWLYFGTGKYNEVMGENDDKNDKSTMSFYALKDAGTPSFQSISCSVSGSGNFTIDCSSINEIEIHSCDSILNNCSWISSNGNPDCCENLCPSDCWTCVYDFIEKGERVVDSALVAGGLVFVTTFVPSNDPCASGGESYLYAFNYTCDLLDHNPFDGSGLKTNYLNEDNNWQEGAPSGEEKAKAYRVKLGSGMPSKPVLDSSGKYVLVQTSDAKIHRIKVKLLHKPFYLKGWKEK